MFGKWTQYALNGQWIVFCYPSFGHFGPHRDGCRIDYENNQSIVTTIGYLMERPFGFGGATRLLINDSNIYQNNQRMFTTLNYDLMHRVEDENWGEWWFSSII